MDKTTNNIHNNNSELNDIPEPLLSHEETMQLIVRAQNGDKEAKDKLVLSNLKLVHHCAGFYYGQGSPHTYEDLVHEGICGLIHAIHLFDVNSGCRLSTYACIAIRNFIENALCNNDRLIRIPRNNERAYYQIEEVLDKYNTRIFTDEIYKEIKEKYNLSKEVVDSIYRARQTILSIDTPITKINNEEDVNILNFIASSAPSIEDICVEKECKAEINKLVNQYCTYTQRKYLNQHFGLNKCTTMSTKELAEKYNVSRAAVNNNIAYSLNNLRKHKGKFLKYKNMSFVLRDGETYV